MTQIEYRLKLGQDEFVIKADVANEIEFFEKMSFYSNLPKTGPNGETDLKVVHRTTREGHNYYSLVSEKSGMEFKFGQVKEAKGGGLYPKGWVPLYQRDQEQTNDVPNQTTSAPLLGAPVMPQPVQQSSPVNSNFPGMVNPTTGPSASVAQPQARPAASAPTPQVQNAAANVLARFGVKS